MLSWLALPMMLVTQTKLSCGACTDTKSPCPQWGSFWECFRMPELNCDCALSCNTPSECDAASGDQDCRCLEYAKNGRCESESTIRTTTCPYTCNIRATVTCSAQALPSPAHAEPTMAGPYKAYDTLSFRCVPGSTNTSPSAYDKKMQHCHPDGTWKTNYYYDKAPRCTDPAATTSSTSTTSRTTSTTSGTTSTTSTTTSTTTSSTTTTTTTTLAPVIVASMQYIQSCFGLDFSFLKVASAGSATVVQTVTLDNVSQCLSTCAVMIQCTTAAYKPSSMECILLTYGGSNIVVADSFWTKAK